MGRLLFSVVLLVGAFVFVGCDTTSPMEDTDDGVGTRYSQEEIDYFLEIAMGAEFGDTTPRIRKWTNDVAINVQGDPTDADLATLQQVIGELNALITGVELRLDEPGANVEIHFAPEREFSQIEPTYVPVNLGFFRVNWNGSGEIIRSRILITTEGVTQQERSHLIREELTQSLGLMRDSNQYPESIFYQRWTDVTRYTDLDEAIIEILYRPDIRPNMTQSQVLSVLNNLSS